ncbi:MAG TPA: TetR/AcrR family transcriptional regulator [Roseiflexaceae bacterium]|nr:TetR/AcrR family transcriptional regulator [Roseiflexaceae bacterium]
MQPTNALTAKGERTREHLLDIALQRFEQNGYEATTMREIAAAAGCSLGLAYRYFASKEEFVLALYARLEVEFVAAVDALPPAPLAQRFGQTLEAKFAQLAPHREALGALAGAALNPRSNVAVLGDTTADVRRRVSAMFLRMVRGSTDAPRERVAHDLALVLYVAHLALILFWLYDRTPGQRATHELVTLGSEVLGVTRRLLRLPPIARALSRLARIAEPMFAGGVAE